jgi:hypothetical protein
MDAIGATVKMDVGIYAMKKVMQTQEQEIMKLLESVVIPPDNTMASADLTGVGQTLDVKA